MQGQDGANKNTSLPVAHISVYASNTHANNPDHQDVLSYVTSSGFSDPLLTVLFVEAIYLKST